MFSHINLGISDLDRAVEFYGAVLTPLGLVQKFVDAGDGVAGWCAHGTERPVFLVCLPLDGRPAGVGNGQMTAFRAGSRAAVRAAHAAAMAQGGSDEGAPGPRAQYHPDYFGGYFRDPDGNKICVCCHEAEG